MRRTRRAIGVVRGGKPLQVRHVRGVRFNGSMIGGARGWGVVESGSGSDDCRTHGRCSSRSNILRVIIAIREFKRIRFRPEILIDMPHKGN